MNNRQKKTVSDIRAINSQIKWAEVKSLLRALGATMRQGRGSRVKFEYLGHRLALHIPHNPDILKEYQVKLVSEFLDKIGV